MPNLSYRCRRCCLTAASLIDKAVAISLVEAGSLNSSPRAALVNRAMRTSRSRRGRRGAPSGARVQPGVVGAGRLAPKDHPGPADAALVAVAERPLAGQALAV